MVHSLSPPSTSVCFLSLSVFLSSLFPSPPPLRSVFHLISLLVYGFVCPRLSACLSLSLPRTRELQKLKSRLLRTQSLKVLPLKPGVGQYIAIHATLTARDFFLANFYSCSPFTCLFFENLSGVFPVLAVANTGSCAGQQNKLVTLLDAGSRVKCSRKRNRLQNMCDCFPGFAFPNCAQKLSCGLR